MKEFSGSVCSEINQVNKVRNLDGWKRHNYLLGTIRPSWPVPSQKTKSFFGGIEKIMVCAITLHRSQMEIDETQSCVEARIYRYRAEPNDQ